MKLLHIVFLMSNCHCEVSTVLPSLSRHKFKKCTEKFFLCVCIYTVYIICIGIYVGICELCCILKKSNFISVHNCVLYTDQ